VDIYQLVSNLAFSLFFSKKQKEERKAFRISEHEISLLRNTLKLFEGTHNYHNFTCKKRFEEANSLRYIMSFEVFVPFLSSLQQKQQQQKQQKQQKQQQKRLRILKFSGI